MSSDDREDLLARLARGDMAVAETLFAAFAPFLRAVVRCQLSAPCTPSSIRPTSCNPFGSK